MNISAEQAVILLDALSGESASDCERDHIEADAIVLKVVPTEVRDAYERFVDRAGGLWYA